MGAGANPGPGWNKESANTLYGWYTGLAYLLPIVGGLIGYLALSQALPLLPIALAVAAASLLYVAVADLIPGLHRRPQIQASIEQVALICAGIGTIWGVGALLHH